MNGYAIADEKVVQMVYKSPHLLLQPSMQLWWGTCSRFDLDQARCHLETQEMKDGSPLQLHMGTSAINHLLRYYNDRSRCFQLIRRKNGWILCMVIVNPQLCIVMKLCFPFRWWFQHRWSWNWISDKLLSRGPSVVHLLHLRMTLGGISLHTTGLFCIFASRHKEGDSA